MIATVADGWVIVTFDPRTDCLRYDFMGWIRVIEPLNPGAATTGNAMVRVEVVETLIGPPAGERFDLAYNSPARAEQESAAALAAGREEVVYLSDTDFNEYPVGSEWLIFGQRAETGEFTTNFGTHYRILSGHVEDELPSEYLSACALPKRPLVKDFLAAVRRVAPYFRLRSSVPSSDASSSSTDGAAERPSAVWARLRHRHVAADVPMSNPDFLVLESSDFPRTSAEWLEAFPVEAVWGEATVDDCAVVLISARDAAESLVVVPISFVHDGLRWKLVTPDLWSAREVVPGVPALRPDVVETLNFWAEREIGRIAHARVQEGPRAGL